MSMNYPDYGVGAWDPQSETYVDYLIRLNDAERTAGGGVYGQPGPQPGSGPAPAPAAPTSLVTVPTPQPGAPPVAAPAGVGGLTPAQLSTQSIIQSALRQYGLDTPDLLQWARDSVVNGSTSDQMLLELYDPSSTPGKVVAATFPELQLRQQNGYKPLSISDAQATRDQLKQVLHTYLPAGMYDSPAELAQFIGHDKSAAELNSELQMHAADAFEWANAGDRASTVSEMQRLYGVGATSKEILASYIDPGLAENVVKQREAAAQIGAASINSGFGPLGQTEAQQVASLGVSQSQAAQGFGQLSAQRELFGGLPGEQSTGISREQQLAAAFGGDQQAQDAIQRRAAARAAVFGDRSGGPGFAVSRTGMSGLGVAST